jgi:hypothetical protein
VGEVLRWIAISAAAAVAALLSAPAALACSPYSHCYGRLDWAPAGTYTGGLANLKVTRLTVSNPSSNFADTEMWAVTDGMYAWVEGGLVYGVTEGGNHGLAIFWAEENTIGSYAEHYVQNASYGAGYSTKISYSGSGRWSVYLNGARVGESSANHSGSLTHLVTGAELTANDARVTGTMQALQKRASDNVSWSYNWPTTAFLRNPPATAGWAIQYTDAWDSAN